VTTVFIDVDTQIDFLFPAGALYVPGAETRLPAIVQLNGYAVGRGWPLISSTDAHLENDPEFRDWPAHCVSGAAGQAKPSSTLAAKLVVIPAEPAEFTIAGAQQFIVEKRTLDVFSNPNFPELLRRLEADEYVVYGVVTEYCVKMAALGLLATGKPVRLVADAIQSLNAAGAARTIAEFTAKGGILTTVQEVLP
jgi:nicotinamidase/pyrazinamidase